MNKLQQMLAESLGYPLNEADILVNQNAPHIIDEFINLFGKYTSRIIRHYPNKYSYSNLLMHSTEKDYDKFRTTLISFIQKAAQLTKDNNYSVIKCNKSNISKLFPKRANNDPNGYIIFRKGLVNYPDMYQLIITNSRMSGECIRFGIQKDYIEYDGGYWSGVVNPDVNGIIICISGNEYQRLTKLIREICE